MHSLSDLEQSKLESLIESVANIVTGFGLSWASWVYIIPLIDPAIETNASQGFIITMFFTGISFIRNYIWRRFFNKRQKNRISRFLSKHSLGKK